jgi:hypothetical protein
MSAEEEVFDLVEWKDEENLRARRRKFLHRYLWITATNVSYSTMLTNIVDQASPDVSNKGIVDMLSHGYSSILDYWQELRDNQHSTTSDTLSNYSALKYFINDGTYTPFRDGYNRNLFSTGTPTSAQLDWTGTAVTGSEDLFRRLGYHFGVAAPRIPSIQKITATGNVDQLRLSNLVAAQLCEEGLDWYIGGWLQSTMAKLILGAAYDKIPTNLEALIPSAKLDSRFEHFVRTKSGITLRTNEAQAFNYDFESLPALSSIRTSMTKKFPFSQWALDQSRDLFGYAVSDVLGDYALIHELALSTEEHVDKNVVGPSMAVSLKYLNTFKQKIHDAKMIALEQDEWTFKKAKTYIESRNTNVTLSTWKGFMNPQNHLPALYHQQAAALVKNNNHWYSDMPITSADLPISMALAAIDDTSALYFRGPWNLDSVGVSHQLEMFLRAGSVDNNHFYGLCQPNWVQYRLRKGIDLSYINSGTLTTEQPGSNDMILYSGDFHDWIGIDLINIESPGLSPQVINANLPQKAYPLPVVAERIYNLNKRFSYIQRAMRLNSVKVKATTDNMDIDEKLNKQQVPTEVKEDVKSEVEPEIKAKS